MIAHLWIIRSAGIFPNEAYIILCPWANRQLTVKKWLDLRGIVSSILPERLVFVMFNSHLAQVTVLEGSHRSGLLMDDGCEVGQHPVSLPVEWLGQVAR
jgi:hypothetical protein